MRTLPLRSIHDPDWLQMRLALWPEANDDEHLEEMAGFLARPEHYAQFIARNDRDEACGFVEASIRNDYVNGTETSPVAFLEGIYVNLTARRKGVARALVDAVARWAKSKGCAELASDTSTRNRTSHAVHKGLGFVETERVVYFNKSLT